MRTRAQILTIRNYCDKLIIELNRYIYYKQWGNRMNVKHFILMSAIMALGSTILKASDLKIEAKKLKEALETASNTQDKERRALKHTLQTHYEKEMSAMDKRHLEEQEPYYAATKHFVENNLSFIEEKILNQDCNAYLDQWKKNDNRGCFSARLSEDEESALLTKIVACCRISNGVMSMLPTEERKLKIDSFRKKAAKDKDLFGDFLKDDEFCPHPLHDLFKDMQ
jgi:hypothetical protein